MRDGARLTMVSSPSVKVASIGRLSRSVVGRQPRGMQRFILGVLCALTFLLPAGGVAEAANLTPAQVKYLGYFYVPKTPGFTWMEGGLAMALRCLGGDDPSFSDGYPGCIVVSGKFQPAPDPVIIGAFDIVPPTMTGTNEANIVVPMYDVTAGYPNDNFPEAHSGKLESVFEIYVVESGGVCQSIHWWYIGFYTDKPIGVPIYGISDCDTTNPTVRGMWPVTENTSPPGNMGADPLHPHKYDRGIIKIPRGIADKYFDGYRQAFASGKQTGTEGTSAGPSLAIRTQTPWSAPDTCEIDIQPALYYYTGTRDKYQGYPRWYLDEQFATTDGYEFTNVHRGNGGEIVADGNFSAYVQPIRRPYFCPDCYPANDPNAGPTYCTNCTVRDRETIQYRPGHKVYSEKYREYPKKYPDPDKDVITWYGMQSCGDGKEADYKQFPSWVDWIAGGGNSPMDCKIKDSNASRVCEAGTGPNGVNYHTELVFYSVPELSDAYKGSRKPYEIMPYAELEITPDRSNDGYNAEDYCIGKPIGTTYDEESNILFVGYGGPTPFIQMFKIDDGR